MPLLGRHTVHRPETGEELADPAVSSRPIEIAGKGLLAVFALVSLSCAMVEFNTGEALSGSNSCAWPGLSLFMHCARMHF